MGTVGLAGFDRHRCYQFFQIAHGLESPCHGGGRGRGRPRHHLSGYRFDPRLITGGPTACWGRCWNLVGSRRVGGVIICAAGAYVLHGFISAVPLGHV